MHQCNAISLLCLSSPHSPIALSDDLLSNPRTEPSLPLLNSDATPIKSKVALQLTALPCVDYSSMVSTTDNHYYQEWDHHHMEYSMCIDSLCIIIIAQFLLHMYNLFSLGKHLCCNLWSAILLQPSKIPHCQKRQKWLLLPNC